MHGLDDAADVVRQHLAQGFVHLRDGRLAPKPEPIEAKAETLEPKTQTPTTVQPSASYEPDKTAVEFLKQISKGIAYASQLAEVLRLEPEQVRQYLKQLESNNLIRYHRPEGLAPCWQLTPEGNELLSKPIRLISFPTRPTPRVFLRFNAHHPDDVDNNILLYMYSKDAPRRVHQISEVMNLNPHEARLRMNKLRGGGYLSDVFDPVRRYEQYRLSDEGVEYILWMKSNDT